MSDTRSEEGLSRTMLAVFLIGGMLGAIAMSCLAYLAMIDKAL